MKTGWIMLLLILLGGCVVADEAPKAINMGGTQPMMANNTRCFPTRQLIAGLLQEHGERQSGMGYVANDNDNGKLVVSHLVSDQGSWTIIISGPSGQSCLMVWGKGWKTREFNKATM